MNLFFLIVFWMFLINSISYYFKKSCSDVTIVVPNIFFYELCIYLLFLTLEVLFNLERPVKRKNCVSAKLFFKLI